MGKEEQSYELLQEALEIQDNPRQMIKKLDKSIKKHSNAANYYFRGLAKYELEKQKDAIKDFDKSFKLSLDSNEVALLSIGMLASTYLSEDFLNRKKWKDLSKTTMTCIQVCDALRGKFPEYDENFILALASSCKYLGEYYAREKDWGNAAFSYKKAVEYGLSDFVTEQRYDELERLAAANAGKSKEGWLNKSLNMFDTGRRVVNTVNFLMG